MMISKLVAWVEKFAEHKKSEAILFWFSFAESSFFPIPPDVLIIAILSHHIKRAWIRIASITTAGSVLGGLFGYAIGYYFYQYIGLPVIQFYNLEEQVTHVGVLFNDNAFVAILIAAFTPIPYKVFTIAGGLFSINLITFIAASIVGRGARFFLTAYLSDRFGQKAKQMILNTGDKFLWFVGIVGFITIYFLSK